jgi:hypothetical protein
MSDNNSDKDTSFVTNTDQCMLDAYNNGDISALQYSSYCQVFSDGPGLDVYGGVSSAIEIAYDYITSDNKSNDNKSDDK